MQNVTATVGTLHVDDLLRALKAGRAITEAFECHQIAYRPTTKIQHIKRRGSLDILQ